MKRTNNSYLFMVSCKQSKPILDRQTAIQSAEYFTLCQHLLRVVKKASYRKITVRHTRVMDLKLLRTRDTSEWKNNHFPNCWEHSS